jgi:anti-sigma factor RsiW
MNDCPNAEIRDRLPDLLHDRLDPSARAAVTAHVATCVDCHDELELLRGTQGMLIARTPRVDVAAIVAALPKATIPEVRAMRPRRTFADWRIAAAVTLLIAGGSSVALYSRAGVQGVPTIATGTTVESIAAPSKNSVAPIPTTAGSRAIPAETVAMNAGEETEAGPAVASAAADMNDRQLQALLDDINRMEAVPITDPDPIVLKVTPRTPASTSGRGTE